MEHQPCVHVIWFYSKKVGLLKGFIHHLKWGDVILLQLVPFKDYAIHPQYIMRLICLSWSFGKWSCTVPLKFRYNNQVGEIEISTVRAKVQTSVCFSKKYGMQLRFVVQVVASKICSVYPYLGKCSHLTNVLVNETESERVFLCLRTSKTPK